MAGLSTQDQHFFKEFSFGDNCDLPFHSVHQAIAYHAASNPDSIAVEHLDDKLSYSELERRGNILAARLQSMGVRPGSRVCLLAHRSLIMFVAIIGIIKAGGVYVPLDGRIVTQSTLEHVIRDSGCILILSPDEFHHRVQNTGVPVLPLDDIVFRNDTAPHVKLRESSHLSGGIYVIYTSGTTDKPKGVEVSHSSVINLVCLSPGNFGMRQGYRVSQLMNIASDIFSWEILGSLSNGCTLCIGGDTLKAERSLLKTVDVLIATPSMLMRYNPKDYPNIQVVATTGEACPQNIADAWAEGATFYNCYGRAEVTIVNTVQSHERGSTLSIGRPTPNNNIYVLNEEGNPLPIGQVGVIWAGGAGITRGYLNLPDESEECYRVDPFVGNGSYMFNTGDLGRWLPDGTLEHLGRIDDQSAPKIEGDEPGKLVTDGTAELEFPPATYNGVIARSGTVDPEKVLTEVSSKSSISLSTLEKAEPWDGYENDTLPPKKQARYLRNLRHQIFSLYRRLFGIVFVVNMSIAIAILCQGGASAQRLGLIVIANISSSIFMRQDYVINAFFAVFCAVPLSWPLWIRKTCARVYHIGGLHSGFAVSGVVWLALFTGQATRELIHNTGPTSLLTVVVTYCILVLLLGIVISAIPVLRAKYHNRFEVTHRFLGWTATALVWCQVVSLTNDYKRQDQSLGRSLIHAAPFWLVLVMTISIVLPWLRLRKLPVRAVVLSSHAVRLYFDYATPVAGSFIRISDSPLTEWHSFATIAEPGKRGFSSVVSLAGDWTSKKIQNPPSEIWVRGIPTTGFIHVVPLFRRVVLVATGSGIAPCIPSILEQRVPTRLLWTSPDVRQTFGDELVDTVLEKSPDAVIYDTRVYGRPDMVKLTYRLVQEFKAEAVCIISNHTLTQKVVYGMLSRGIPAFGAIWDS